MTEFYITDICKKQYRNKFSAVIESPTEINNEIMGKELTEFVINTGKEDTYCNEIEEIYMEFQGKEMRIFINREGKLQVYTD